MEENEDQSIHEGAPDDQNSSSGQTQTRSYECNFCRRGFSNAQALGGHMNIHRKDKAKIKQQSSSKPANKSTNPQQQQLRIMENPRTATTPSSPPPIPSRKIQRLEFVMSTIDDETSMISVPAWVLPPAKEDRSKEYQKLQLFAETPSSAHQDHHHDGASAASESTARHISSNPLELDLELRLGPEPRDSSSSSTEWGTKKFF